MEQGRQTTRGVTPVAFSAYALLILLSRFFLGGLPDRIDPSITYYGGLALMALGLGTLAVGPSPALAVGAAGVLGFGFSFPWSSTVAPVLRKIPSNERGSAVGVLSAFVDLFVGISSFVAGGVAKHFGYSAAFVLAAVAVGGGGDCRTIPVYFHPYRSRSACGRGGRRVSDDLNGRLTAFCLGSFRSAPLPNRSSDSP